MNLAESLLANHPIVQEYKEKIDALDERMKRIELYVKVYHQEQREIHGQIVAEIDEHDKV